MTSDNLCNSCTNIGCEFQSGIIRTECAFYMPPHIEPDNCGNYVIKPTVNVLNKIKAKIEQGYCKVENDYDRGRNMGLHIAVPLEDVLKAISERFKEDI